MCKKTLLLLLVSALLPAVHIFAEDPSDPDPPINKGGGGNPVRPNAPARHYLYYYIEGDLLMIEAPCDELGFVTLTDATTNNVIFQGTASLYPQFEINVAGLNGTFYLDIDMNGQQVSYTIFIN